MKSKSLLSLFAVLLLHIPAGLWASEFTNATVEMVRPDNYDVGGVFIQLSGTMSGTSPCTFPNGGGGNYYFITKNNALMKELLTVALSARLAGKNVWVLGTGTCTQGYEDVRFIELK
jgi:hypothetical protein